VLAERRGYSKQGKSKGEVARKKKENAPSLAPNVREGATTKERVQGKKTTDPPSVSCLEWGRGLVGQWEGLSSAA
jgi:hypothetical protein